MAVPAASSLLQTHFVVGLAYLRRPLVECSRPVLVQGPVGIPDGNGTRVHG